MTISSLEGAAKLTVRASDGEIGKAEQLYFDDHTWAVRYFVVTTGTWLLGPRVLLVPMAVEGIHDEEKVLQVNLTRQQVENSPALDSQMPISRKYEEEYFKHYGWTPYWGVDAGTEPYPPPPRVIAKSLPDDEVPARDIRQSYLRSSAEVTGYFIQARDGEIGHVEDFLIDDHDWTVRYLEVDTRNWWPGKKVLVSPAWIEDINWSDRRVSVKVDRQAIKSAPEYDPSMVVGPDYEIALFEHYSSRVP